MAAGQLETVLINIVSWDIAYSCGPPTATYGSILSFQLKYVLIIAVIDIITIRLFCS